MEASQDEKRKGLEHAMSNQEAADILKKLVCYSVGGRGNGKSHTMMKIEVALSKAIQSLEQDSQH